MSFYQEGYYFVPWRRVPKAEWADAEDSDSFELDLPEGVYAELLSRLGYGGAVVGHYPAICLMRWAKGTPEPLGLRAVSADLKRLLWAGRVYKPALAFANNACGRDASEGRSEAKVVEQFTRVLRHELDHQRERPFFLAKAIQPCYIGYRFPGDYVWIIDYDPDEEEPVWWVTSDYELYTDVIMDFDVDVAYLAERFAVRPKAGV